MVEHELAQVVTHPLAHQAHQVDHYEDRASLGHGQQAVLDDDPVQRRVVVGQDAFVDDPFLLIEETTAVRLWLR